MNRRSLATLLLVACGGLPVLAGCSNHSDRNVSERHVYEKKADGTTVNTDTAVKEDGTVVRQRTEREVSR